MRSPGFHPELQELGVVAQVCNPSTQEVKSGGSDIKVTLSYLGSSRTAWPYLEQYYADIKWGEKTWAEWDMPL